MSETTATKSEETIVPIDGIQLLRSYLLHCRYVQRGLNRISRELVERADRHDDSKLMADEFSGFSRINKAAREHPYGSSEYRAGLKQEKPTINLHYSRNSHHPEYFNPFNFSPSETGDAPAIHMSWLDIIEMVCDWRGAYLGYGSQGTWEENIQRQRERYAGWFTPEQWWLVEQIAEFVATVD